MRDLFEQMGVAHDMERQQVQSLLIEPLQAMIDDPKGLAGKRARMDVCAVAEGPSYLSQ